MIDSHDLTNIRYSRRLEIVQIAINCKQVVKA